MALSGTISNSYRGWTYQISWTATQSISDNTSTIKCTHKLICDSSYALDIGSRSNTCTVDGTSKSFTSSAINTSGGTTITLGTTTHTVNHNTDGTKSCTIKGVFNLNATLSGTYKGSITASKTVTLNTIARKSTLSVANGTLGTAQTLTITEQASTFKHKLTYSCGSVSGYILGSSSAFSTSNSTSWTPPISLAAQNTSGTSVSIKFTLYTYMSDGTSIGNNSYTKSFTIPASVKPSCSVAVTDAMGYETTYGAFIKGLSKFKVVVTPTLAHGSAIASYSTTANGSTYSSSSFTTNVLKSSGTLTVKATVKDKRGRSSDAASVSKTVLNYAAPTVNLKVERCDADGTLNDQGENIKVTFGGNVTSLNNKNSAAYTLKYKKSSASNYTEVALSDYAGNYSVSGATYIFAADTGRSYNVELAVSDDFNTTTRATTASTAFTILHFLASGLGMAIGKVAEIANALEIGWNAIFHKNIYMGHFHDAEKNIYFRNAASESGQTYENNGLYPHDCKIYGGNAGSPYAIGMYDLNTDRRILVYDDHDNYIKTETIIRQHIAVAHPSSNVSLTSTDWVTIPLDTMWSPTMAGDYLSLSNGNILCGRAGYLKVSAQCYVSGLTANDSVGIGVLRNSTRFSYHYNRQNATAGYVSLVDNLIDVSAGDLVKLQVRNSTNAKGTVTSGKSYTRLVVEYVG